ncbi:hypothetical protein KABACHOK_00160 [Brevundimonas phage vB_BpoS-Kabachok]|uniref:Uncharacterized protein n=1 Tax=Brevundimonas phage vB_BpoS-Kabachok TaxID=2948600 RepID=A0A9E7SJ13_9CAUD|nr:hypothetical protein KABACHOK_00160 [Brevundimonas phage vB_BpoS-Kabachok]
MSASDDHEFAIAGYVMADMLASSLYPRSGTWDGVRAPYIWEHNALCWLHRNRARIPRMSDWTAHVLNNGYPFRPFVDSLGVPRPAGYLWNETMAARD